MRDHLRSDDVHGVDSNRQRLLEIEHQFLGKDGTEFLQFRYAEALQVDDEVDAGDLSEFAVQDAFERVKERRQELGVGVLGWVVAFGRDDHRDMLANEHRKYMNDYVTVGEI